MTTTYEDNDDDDDNDDSDDDNYNDNCNYDNECGTRRRLTTYTQHLQCESKKVAPLKLFAVFSLLVNLCN